MKKEEVSEIDKKIKIIYYGPPICGKYTNLEHIQKWYCDHEKITQAPLYEKGSLVVNSCSFVCSNRIKKTNIPVYLPIYPQKLYKDLNRDKIIKGAKAFVYVVDSQKERMEANFHHLKELEVYIKNEGYDISSFPLVFQYNKRDLPNIVSIEELNRKFNKFNAPYFSSVAKDCIGVKETFTAILELVV